MWNLQKHIMFAFTVEIGRLSQNVLGLARATRRNDVQTVTVGVEVQRQSLPVPESATIKVIIMPCFGGYYRNLSGII